MSSKIGLLRVSAEQMACSEVALGDKAKSLVLGHLPAGYSGGISTTECARGMTRSNKLAALIIFTHYKCIDDGDANRIRLGDVIIQCDAEPSAQFKSAIARCLARGTDISADTAKLLDKFGRPTEWMFPTDVKDYRQAAGDRQGPAVHWIPTTDTKLVRDINDSGDIQLALRIPVILIGGVADYQNKCPSYGHAFAKVATLNAAVVLGDLVDAFGSADKDVKWPPVSTIPETRSAVETKGDVKAALDTRQVEVKTALEKRQAEVKIALDARQLEERKSNHAAALAKGKRKIEQLSGELEQAAAKVRKLESDLKQAVESLAKLEMVVVV